MNCAYCSSAAMRHGNGIALVVVVNSHLSLTERRLTPNGERLDFSARTSLVIAGDSETFI